MDYDDKTIMNFKFFLYCVERMTGLKINFHKSEVFTLCLSDREKDRVANMLNCKIRSLPMTYLGIQVSDKHLGVNALRGVPEKLRKRWRLTGGEGR